MDADIPLGMLGRIVNCEGARRAVEALDDSERTGGYLIFTYADTARSPEVFDSWVEDRQGVKTFFRDSGWQIEWLSD